MTLTAAAALANVLNFIMYIMMAVWYVAPWLARRPRAEALVPLLWVQAFRDIALQIFSAQRFGFAVSDETRDAIMLGDVIATILAVGSIVALRYRANIAPLLMWALVAETVFDLTHTSYLGVREHLYESASAVTFLIVTFYTPLLWVSLGLLVWQLYARRHEALSFTH